jgi:hypothetical protein
MYYLMSVAVEIKEDRVAIPPSPEALASRCQDLLHDHTRGDYELDWMVTGVLAGQILPPGNQPPAPPGNNCAACARSGVGACDDFPQCQEDAMTARAAAQYGEALSVLKEHEE